MKKLLAIMLALVMVLALVPTVAFAAGDVAWIGETGYKTLKEAVQAAQKGKTTTIQLGEGTYTLYDIISGNASTNEYTTGKSLTFIGAGTDKTTWNIGTPQNDKSGQNNGDFSFGGSNTIVFKNMTLKAGITPDGTQITRDYMGFAHTTDTIVEDCIIYGKTFFWGYTSATFKNTTFNCPNGDYAVWTYSSPTMTFDECTFNSSGKVINVYTDYSAGKHNITVNFKNCTVNNTGESLKPVLNINDSNMDKFKYILNITGDNNVTGVDVDNITCSRLFGFGGKADTNNKGKTVVSIDGKTVWTGGRMVRHAIDTQNDKYTDGYKDNAFTVEPNGPGSFEVTCDYCGYTETSTGKLYNDIGLTRTVRQNKNSNPVPEDAANSNKYKVANSSDITVDYTATMDMENLRWQVAGKDVEEIQKKLVELEELEESKVQSPWELLKALAQQIDDRTEVILTFKFDDKIDLKAFKAKYEAAVNAGKPTDVLMLTSDMFEIADGGVQFNTAKGTMTITCKWKEEANTEDTKITLYGFGLPVTNDWNGSKQIKIENSGCVSGMVHINPRGGAAVAMVGPAPNVAANQESIPTPSLDTIQIPIVGGCAADKFTLYYGGGSSGDSSGGSSSGGGYYYPTTTPVPVIVIPPKTGDMTVWQSILHFLGIK